MKYIYNKYKLLFATVIIINIFFFDGIYLNKSYVAFNYERGLVGNEQVKTTGLSSFNMIKRESGESWIDIGGAAFQTNLINIITDKANSIIWTNDLASGNFLLYDFTFQPLSTINIVAKIFGGDIKALNYAFILLITISLFYILLIFKNQFLLTFNSSVLGGILFIGNGFLTSSWSNHVAIPYICCPVFMYYMHGYIFEKKNKIIAPIIGAIYLCNTFLPTLILMTISTFIIYLQLNLSKNKITYKEFLIKYLKLIAIIVLLTAFIYIPSFLIANRTGSVEAYLINHAFYYLPAKGIFLLFSQNLFLSNFNSLYWQAFDWWAVGEFSVIYLGVVPCYYLIRSLFTTDKNNVILIFSLIFFILRVFTPLLEYIFSLPILQSISVGYFFSIIAYLSVFIVAINFEKDLNFQKKHTTTSIILIVLIAISYLIVADYKLVESKKYSIIFTLFTYYLFLILLESNNKKKYILISFLIFLELFLNQNFNKQNLINIDQYNLPNSIKFLKLQNDTEYRVLNTSLNALPPGADIAIGLKGVQSFGHLSVEENYLRDFITNIGSDSKDYPINGFTSCNNINYNKEYLNNLSIKYILTDNGNCKLKFQNDFPVAFKDEKFIIFINNDAKKINYVESKNKNCIFKIDKYMIYEVINFQHCEDSVFYTNTNYSKFFKFIVNLEIKNFEKINNYFVIKNNNSNKIYIILSYVPAYIGFLISLITFLYLIYKNMYKKIDKKND